MQADFSIKMSPKVHQTLTEKFERLPIRTGIPNLHLRKHPRAALFDKIPANNAPPCIDIISPAVLFVKVCKFIFYDCPLPGNVLHRAAIQDAS
jgi:hypothetical protein